ncbi:MAG: MBL fold metallo-hydrolase [Ruminococcaceae bacterium]|nr:MBL fold metallo-hydrolase [Oscillospiraceae bacterium]
MKLTFLGAAHEVTGSCYLLEIAGHHILIDCGSEQGKDLYENPEIPISAKEVDAILLTHSHIDHAGRIPLLVKDGYAGAIYSTDATYDLCGIMLLDSAHIQESDAEWKNRKNQRAGKPLVEPLYTVADAEQTLRQFHPVPYGTNLQLFDEVVIHFTDVGHLLGSAAITITVTENGRTEKLVFSGDIGNTNMAILKDPQYLKEADYVVMESTYGDRTHGERVDTVGALADMIQRTFDRGGNVVIPCFAVGRTQEMLYDLRKVKEQNLVKGHGTWPVYMDSPLALRATKIVSENYAECFDEEALSLVRQGINPLEFPGLKLAETSDESKQINFDETPKVIISASGMCEAGRVRHHLKHNLWRAESTVIFVGHQSNGTLGQVLLDGADQVKLFSETIDVRCEITRLQGLSGHADDKGLMKWIGAFDPKPKTVFVTHGEDAVTDFFADRLKNELGIHALAPYPGAIYDFTAGQWAFEGTKERIQKNAPQKKVNPAYRRLTNAFNRLGEIVRKSEGLSNNLISKFAEQIEALCKKWEK